LLQISLTGRPDGQPTWNHPYLFCDDRDKATMFTPGAALVLEYYIASTGMYSIELLSCSKNQHSN